MKAKNIIELVYNTNIDSNGKATKGKREKANINIEELRSSILEQKEELNGDEDVLNALRDMIKG